MWGESAEPLHERCRSSQVQRALFRVIRYFGGTPLPQPLPDGRTKQPVKDPPYLAFSLLLTVDAPGDRLAVDGTHLDKLGISGEPSCPACGFLHQDR